MLPTSPFGRTGHTSTRTLFGAAAFWEIPQRDADAAMDLLLENGVNHVDTAATYDGSQALLGDWIRRHGRPFFLATKTQERTRQSAYDDLRRSLDLLHVDQVDLVQLHALHREPDWSTAFGPGGALEALIQARQEGLTRFIGVTGHGLFAPSFHLRALQQFDFDSVLLPFNYIIMQNPQYAADVRALLAVARERGIAVQAIKSIQRSAWNGMKPNRATWYRPLEEPADIELAVHWVLGEPGIFLNTVGDLSLLPHVLRAAHEYTARPSDAQMQALTARTGMASMFSEASPLGE
jgi:aryl-alcohol dehydrogenase-like predicted oxidoreductase